MQYWLRKDEVENYSAGAGSGQEVGWNGIKNETEGRRDIDEKVYEE